MGLRQDRLKRGAIVGGTVIGVIAIGVAIAVAIPATRELFLQDRLVEESAGWLLFQALVRIPLATALYDLGGQLKRLGLDEEGLEATREAVEQFRVLVHLRGRHGLGCHQD